MQSGSQPSSSRHWLAVKFGQNTHVINRPRLLEEYAKFLRQSLNDYGAGLLPKPFCDLLFTDDIIDVSKIITDLLVELDQERVKRPRPLMFLVDDYSTTEKLVFKEWFEKFYHDRLYLFTTTAQELDEMRMVGSFEKSRQWCDDFVRYCMLPSEEDEGFQILDSGRNEDTPSGNNDIIQRLNFTAASDEIPMSFSSPCTEPRGDIDVLSPNKSQLEEGLSNSGAPQEETTSGDHTTKPVPFDVIEAANIAFEDPTAQDKAQTIAGPFLFARFEYPFKRPFENYKLLELIHKAIKSPSSRSEKESASSILHSIAEKRYLQYVLNLVKNHEDDLGCLQLLRAVMHIFLSSLDVLDPKERVILRFAWEDFLSLLRICPDNVWNVDPSAKDWFLDSVDLINGHPEPSKEESYNPPPPTYENHQHSQQPDEQQHTAHQRDMHSSRQQTSSWEVEQKRRYDVVDPEPTQRKRFEDEDIVHHNKPSKIAEEVNMTPYWQLSEGQEPPEDFWRLAHHPVRGDVVNPSTPYLRRSIVHGSYNHSHHYLDVQFRLFREDLISPIRDGLASHKINGTSRYTKYALEDGTVSSDIIIFEVDSLGGVQVRSNTGENIRYARLKNDTYLQNAAARHLKFGQLVILSSDGFRDDVHMAVIAERTDNDLVINGIIGLSFYEENGLKIGERYIMAEPANYLEHYVHVLKVFKEIDRFSPLPMERYLVHAKSTTRRPYFLSLDGDLTEEEKNEDKELQKYYDNVSKRMFKNKSDKSEREYTDSDEDDYDLTSLHWSKKNKTVYPVADETLNTHIFVKGFKYNAVTMTEDFQPEGLDESQRKAMVSALTSDMALIQGPPGTGKTFIGVEIVSALIENQWKRGNLSPILLVCYTNAALDQFLEKIYDRIECDKNSRLYVSNGPRVIRLGTKSDSAKLERAGVMRKDVVNEWASEIADEESMKAGKAYGNKRKKQIILGTASYLISREAQSNLLSYETVMQVIPQQTRSEFMSSSRGQRDSQGYELHMDEILACWLLDKSLQQQGAPERGMPPVDEDSDSEEQKKKKKRPKDISDDVEEIQSLDEVFKQLNIDAQMQSEAEAAFVREISDDFYETERPWDILQNNGQIEKDASLFGHGTKEISLRISAPFDETIRNEIDEFKEAILKTKPLSSTDASNIRSVYSLPKQRRWELFAYWCQKLREIIKVKLPNEIANYKRECDNHQEARMALDAKVFSKSLIIGATTTGAAKQRKLLSRIGCKTLIIEEAAEVLEAHTFASILPTVEHAVLIGDHQQLRPNPAVFELARTYRMDVSLFERLINNGTPYSTLTKQHRMNLDITKNLVRPHFYKMLEDADNVRLYPNVSGMAKNMFFWSHKSPESSGVDGASYSNQGEVIMTIALVDYILKQKTYSEHEITIIATYAAQVEKLRVAVRNNFGSKADTTDPAISVQTVDSFQGKENKIIVVSLVRSGGPTIGFLSVVNRICVALTRAQHGMYVVGNMHHLSSKSSVWNEIVGTLDRADLVNTALPIKCQGHGTLQYIEEPDDFLDKSPNGGCTEICGQDLACNHTCPRKCHPLNDHTYWKCTLDCMRVCKNEKYNHPCPKRCFEPCDHLCSVPVTVSLSCDHDVNVACYKSHDPKCDSRCETILPCGHRCRENCGKSCTVSCKEEVIISFNCDHEVRVPCCESRIGLTCKARCAEELPCGHQCQEQCGEHCTFECMEKVDRQMPCGHLQAVLCYKDVNTHLCDFPVKQTLPCNHTVNVPCYAGRDQSKCTASCQKSLPCGHPCGRKCGECYLGGSHQCFETCGKLQPCGHACTKRCGDKCGDCGANCLSGCSHMVCGPSRAMGALAFKRSCREQCVMCIERCDNKCEHRDCTRRCYEICDVKPCEEGCKQQLRCRHACLGMCGEICPEMCGTCHRMQYQDLMKRFMPEAKGFERLIKVRGCGHIFPVKFLDEHVRKFRTNNEWPRCPQCSGAIHSNHRYYKFIKKHILDTYNAKEVSRNALVKKDVGQLSRAFMELIAANVNERMHNGKDRRRAEPLIFTVNSTFDKIRTSAKESGQASKAFWNDVVDVTKCLVKIYGDFLDSPGIPKQLRDNTFFTNFVNIVVPRGHLQQTITDTLEAGCKCIQSNVDGRLSGAMVPRMRHLLTKAMFFFTIGKLWLGLKQKNSDLDQVQFKEIRTIGAQFTRCTMDDDYYSIYVRFITYINDKVLAPLALPPMDSGPDLPVF